VSDRDARSRERTLAGGGPAERLAVASDRLRRGDVLAALEALSQVAPVARTADEADLAERCWREYAERLEPAARVEGPARPYWLEGWLDGGRSAALAVREALGAKRLWLLDRERLALLGPSPRAPGWRSAGAACFAVEGGRVLRATARGAAIEVEVVGRAPVGGAWVEAVEPGGATLLLVDRDSFFQGGVTRRIGLRVADGAATETTTPASRRSLGRETWAAVAADDEGGILLFAPPFTEAPRRLAVVGAPFGALPGRLVVARPDDTLRLVDLATGDATRFAGPSRVRGPFRLAADGAVLALSAGRPVRCPIDPRCWPVKRARGSGDIEPVRWHPRLELALVGERPALWVAGAEAPLRRLPADRVPLGWSPDGRDLLARRIARRSVRREGDPNAGHLELWRLAR